MGMFSNINLVPPDPNAGSSDARGLLSDIARYRMNEKQAERDFQLNLMALQEQQRVREMARNFKPAPPLNVAPPNYSQINFDKSLDAQLQMSRDRNYNEQEKNRIAERGVAVKENLANLKDLTDSEKLAMLQSGRLSLEDLRGSNAMARTEATIKGAGERTAATVAGANERNLNTIAGANARTAATNASAERRNTETVSGANTRNAETIKGQNWRSAYNVAGMDRRAGVETPGGFSPVPPGPDVNLPMPAPASVGGGTSAYTPVKVDSQFSLPVSRFGAPQMTGSIADGTQGVMKQYSPSRNQTRISKDGGKTWTIVQGKQ